MVINCLLAAAFGYDPDTGNKFLTYVEYWIRQRIVGYIFIRTLVRRIWEAWTTTGEK